jgi:hypothetical protein
MGSGRIIGIILLVIGLVLGVILVAWLFAGQGENKLQGTGLVLGLAITLILAAPFVAGGVYLLSKGQAEVKEFAEIEKEKRILNMVLTQGKVQLANAAVEMNLTLDQVKAFVYDLVGKGLFTGYVDWKSNTLFSADASKVGSTTCPNCGGVRELAGKGIVKCPYCGAELFLPQS